MNRERAYTVSLRIIYNGHNARLMHDPVCHCNQLYLDYNSRPSRYTHDLVATSVTLASFIQLRAVVCISCAHSDVLSRDSVCIHRAMRRFASPKHRICREVVLLFIYRLYIFLHDLSCES